MSLSDAEASLLGALPPEKAEAHRRGERIHVTAEEASYFKHQADLLQQRAFDAMKRAIRTYGQHTCECASHTSREGKWLECDCGWNECEFNPENNQCPSSTGSHP